MSGKNLAKLLSVIFHPLLLPSIGVLIIFNSGTILDYMPFQYKKVVLIIIAVTTFVLPLTFVPFFLFQKIIKDAHMGNRKERLVPFLMTSIIYFFCYYLLLRIDNMPLIILRFILTASISVFVLFLLSFKWKISAHMIGIGGLTGSLIAISFKLNVNLEYFIICSVIISGIVGFSRLMLGSHKQVEIYTGWITGLFLSLILLYFS